MLTLPGFTEEKAEKSMVQVRCSMATQLNSGKVKSIIFSPKSSE